MRMRFFAAVFVLFNLSLPSFAFDAIVDRGSVCGEIVVARRGVHAAEEYAGAELQKWIGEITGRYVPVCPVEGTNAAAKVRIWVGRKFVPAQFRKDFNALGQTDGYAVRSIETNGVKNIYVFGSIPRGTLHAAYQLVYRNSDIIWLRPDPSVGTVFSQNDTFALTETDFISVPRTQTRSWQWIYHTPNFENEWESRNLMNRTGTADSKFASCFTTGGVGHGIQLYTNPKENVEKHPEWYPLVNGKRNPGSGQICLTAYDMIPTFVSNMVAEIKAKYPLVNNPAQIKIDYFNLSTADNWVCCDCERCLRSFTCENGKVIANDDECFRSVQYFTFINKVAREIRKFYPNVTVGCYAYQFTAQVPPFKLEKNIVVEYCPYGLNEKARIYDDETNFIWHKYLDEWCGVCSGVWMRYYLGWSNTFPRSLEDVVRDNGIYAMKLPHPLAHYSSEYPTDDPTCTHFPMSKSWDVSGMTAWCICRMWWDPTQDLESIRTDYCKRVYHEAWESMKAWHDGIRDSFVSDNLPSTYNSGDPVLYTAQYIVKPGLTDKFRGYLTDGLAKARHPVSKELIRRQLALFDEWVSKAKLAPPVRLTVKYAANTDAAENFESKDWLKAESTGNFIITVVSKGKGENGEDPATEKPRYRSDAKLLHDGENLIVRFDCDAPDMDKLHIEEKSTGGAEEVPRGDIVEFYIGSAASGVYYQFMLDAGHPDNPSLDRVYDACGWDYAWNGKWTKINKRYADRWSVIMKIPFEDVGINAVQSGKILFQAMRQKMFETGAVNQKTNKPVLKRDFSSWNGGYVHQMQNFGEIILELK